MSRPFILFVVFCSVSAFVPARADIIVSTGPGNNRVSHVTGFRVEFDAPGFKTAFTGDDKALPTGEVTLCAVKLTTRDSPSTVGMSDRPLYLKIYDKRERTRLLGVSTNALRWDPPAGVDHGREQTYLFDGVQVPSGEPLWFTFETAGEAQAPLAPAGLSFITSETPRGYVTLVKNLEDFPHGAPAVSFVFRVAPGAVSSVKEESAPAEGGSPVPVVIGGTLSAGLLLAGVFLLLRKKSVAPVAPVVPRPSAPLRPPPPPPPPGI